MSKKINISPFNRVEGDLEIIVEVKDGKVQNARSKGVMFRGFEMLLKGRDPMDSVVFTPRICGICGASHGVVSSTAIRNAWKSQMPDNAYRVNNIVLAIEILMSHITHFYILFAPDLTNKKYSMHPGFQELEKRFLPFKGTSYLKSIKARPSMLELMGVFAGKWPNTLVFQPGGVTCSISISRQTKALGLLRELQDYVEESLLGCDIDRWLENRSMDDLDKWLTESNHYDSDLGIYVRYGRELGLDKIGKGPDRFLSYGAYELSEGQTWLPSGYYDRDFYPFNQEKITEYIKYSFLKGYQGGLHPSEGITDPDPDKEGAYSWCKSPRYDDNVIEVGPLARMILDKDSLIYDIFNKSGSGVFLRVLARLHEAVRLVRQVGIWIREIDARKPFYKKPLVPPEAKGIGLIEAARGSLGHWLTIKNGKIERYQVITPTAWNLSPKDSFDQHGACEHALNGTIVENVDNPIEVGHVVRSFDPCLVCTVHTIKI
ncbi:MAG: nickel-dependent hydrogenase large subunit [Nitrospirota bacterium]|nr:nickel-dependent hydrogenase large subunit [Nitrospirota bacterium]